MRGVHFKRRWLALVATLAVAAVVVPAGLAITISGSITNSDPTQTGRVNRNGVQATCANPKTNPGLAVPTGAFHYDANTFFNGSASTQCVTVQLSAGDPNCNVLAAAYSSFDPAHPNVNWLADPGQSTGIGPSQGPRTFSLNVTADTAFDVVVSEVVSGAGCTGYTLGVTGSGIISGNPPQAINDLRDLVDSLGIHHGITNALDSKLQDALDALATDDTAGACDSLQSFLNLVNAQTGKKISSGDAQQLTDAANDIRTLLGC
jgi:hypothetical protein